MSLVEYKCTQKKLSKVATFLYGFTSLCNIRQSKTVLFSHHVFSELRDVGRAGDPEGQVGHQPSQNKVLRDRQGVPRTG